METTILSAAGVAVAKPVQPTPAASPNDAAAAVAPDPITAEILRKHALHETLTPSERGKLGVHRARLAGKLGRPPGSGGGPGSRNAPPSAGLRPLAPGLAAPSTVEALPRPPVDPALVRDFFASVLGLVDSVAQTWIETKAKGVNIDGPGQKAWREAVALKEVPRRLMVDNSPAVVELLGVDAAHLPVAAFCSGLLAYVGCIWTAVSELAEIQKLKLLAARDEKSPSEN